MDASLLLSLSLLLPQVEVQEASAQAPTPEDPYLWLEAVTAERSLDWVRARNAACTEELVDGDFEVLRERLRAILDSDEKIPYVRKHGAYLYNLWTDGAHPRGLWRRTTLAEYAKDEPAWETVLDLDALGAAEGESWVWHGATVLEPAAQRCLISLSRGGADADVVREFDLVEKAFVEDGFRLPEAKSGVTWRDADSVYVGTDFGPGSLTASGYPRVIKLWKRGTPLSEAETVCEGHAEDVLISVSRDLTPGFERDVMYRAVTFWTNEVSVRSGDEWVRLDKPLDANVDLHREWLFLELRSDWEVDGVTHRAGSLLAKRLDRHLAGEGRFETLFEPTERVSLAGHSATRNHLLVTTLDNVRSRIHVLTPPSEAGASWERSALAGLPEIGSLSISALDPVEGDDYLLRANGFTTPSSLLHGVVGSDDAPRLLASAPHFFDAEGLVVEQHGARSADGTLIPYFEVRRADLGLDGRAPTLLYAYGGFEVSLKPGYSATRGAAWLERGGVFVLANIRGGGEFGPRWHQAALKANRNRCYEDLAAVARDLVRREVTSPAHLGVMGGSNGGLMVGNMITQYPELFGAAVCQVPLLDMRRYHLLLAGASWKGEYGDPDVPEEWEYIQGFSPYHLVEAGMQLPRTLFTTSTRDDRVHPGHARKMVARMQAQGHDVLYYENLEGGHGGAADNDQRAFMSALGYEFLWGELAEEVGP